MSEIPTLFVLRTVSRWMSPVREDISTAQISRVSVCRGTPLVKMIAAPMEDVISIRNVGVMTPSEERPAAQVGMVGSEDTVVLSTILSLKENLRLKIRKMRPRRVVRIKSKVRTNNSNNNSQDPSL